jgi:hypothetical protein
MKIIVNKKTVASIKRGRVKKPFELGAEKCLASLSLGAHK